MDHDPPQKTQGRLAARITWQSIFIQVFTHCMGCKDTIIGSIDPNQHVAPLMMLSNTKHLICVCGYLPLRVIWRMDPDDLRPHHPWRICRLYFGQHGVLSLQTSFIQGIGGATRVRDAGEQYRSLHRTVVFNRSMNRPTIATSCMTPDSNSAHGVAAALQYRNFVRFVQSP